jgi:putative DNA primase/helicase
MAQKKLRAVAPPDDDAPQTIEDQWVSASEIKSRPLTWLLPGRLPDASVVLVEGAKNASKSTFCAALAAAVTRGRPLFGRKRLPKGCVLWSCGEEDPDRHVVPRLLLHDADMARVKFLPLDDLGMRRRIWLPSCIDFLRQSVLYFGVRLIVLDPLSSHVPPEISLKDDQAIHSALDPLAWLSFAVGCCVVLTRNLTKDRTAKRVDRGIGGSAVSGVARSVVVIERPDPAKTTRILRVVVKNVGRDVPPVEYDLEGPGEFAKLVRARELTDLPDDDNQDGDEPEERDAIDNAIQLLRALLAGGPVDVQEIQREAEAAMILPRTLRRAKFRLKISHRRVPGSSPAKWQWCPPKGGF